MNRARLSLFALVVSLGTVAAACGGGPGSSYVPESQAAMKYGGPVAVVVKIEYGNFAPSTVTIHAGQTVEWVWDDAPTPHDVAFADFSSPAQATGTYFHMFLEPGTYPYSCTLHPDMTGKVVVLP